MRTRTKRKGVQVCQNVHTHICAWCTHVFAQNLMKIVLIVHYYVMTLSLKYHKDPNFCCEDICKITLNINMHARGINACAKLWRPHVHVFASCVQIFTKLFLVVHNSIRSSSFKFNFVQIRSSIAEIFANYSVFFFILIIALLSNYIIK